MSKVWAIEPSEAAFSDLGEEPLVPYRTADYFGYVTVEGHLFLRDSVLFDLAIGDAAFVNYTSLGTDLVVQLPDGTVEATLDTRGYPFIINNRVFVVATNRARIEEWSIDGAMRWHRDYGALLTAFDAGDEASIAGLLDGRVQVYDSSGGLLFDSTINSGRIQAVYGCAISPDGTSFAVIHGLDPQMLTVFRRIEHEYQEIATVSLESGYRRSRWLFLSSGGETVFFEDRDAVSAFSVQSSQIHSVPLAGNLVDYGTLGGAGCVWFTAVDNGIVRMAILSDSGIPYSTETYIGDWVAGVGRDVSIIVGGDDEIARIDVLSR